MASWQRIESGDAGRLAYGDRSSPLVCLLLSLCGLAGTIGIGGQVVLSFLNPPQDLSLLGGLVLGALLCLVLLAMGLKMLVHRD